MPHTADIEPVYGCARAPITTDLRFGYSQGCNAKQAASLLSCHVQSVWLSKCAGRSSCPGISRMLAQPPARGATPDQTVSERLTPARNALPSRTETNANFQCARCKRPGNRDDKSSGIADTGTGWGPGWQCRAMPTAVWYRAAECQLPAANSHSRPVSAIGKVRINVYGSPQNSHLDSHWRVCSSVRARQSRHLCRLAPST